MKGTADISITIGLLEAEIDSLKDAYKNCKFSAHKREYSTQLVSHKQALKMLKQAAAIEPLINQEVEKRIKERMPSEEEIRDELCRHLYNWLEHNSFKDACRWFRSRLTPQVTPQDTHQEKKSEGGEG